MFDTDNLTRFQYPKCCGAAYRTKFHQFGVFCPNFQKIQNLENIRLFSAKFGALTIAILTFDRTTATTMWNWEKSFGMTNPHA